MSETELPKKNLVKKSRVTLEQMTEIFSGAEVKDMKTFDGFDNFVSKLGLNNANTLSAGQYVFNLVTRNRILLEAAYRGSWIVGALVDSVAEDMTRAGVNVSTAKGDKNIKEFKNAVSRLKISQSLCFGIKWGRLYGGSIAVLQVKGQNLATPLNLETIAKGQFQGIVTYDRWQLNPVLTDLIDSGPDMGLPQYYDIVGDPRAAEPEAKTATGQLRVHFSRLVRFTGIELPYYQAITEMMWGESNLERLWDRLIAFDNATMSSASLIDRANLRTVGVDGLREIIAAGGEAQAGLLAQFEMMRALQVNEGLTLIDKEDTFQSTSYSFAGLSDMMLQFGQQLSGAAKIPLIRLFGQAPAGLGADGEEDIRLYYDSINAEQEAKLRNGWELIIKVMWRSCFGEDCPDDMEFAFVPLWQMSATDKANNGKTIAETIIGAYEATLTSKSTAMKELRQASGETGIFGNITDEEIAEAEEQDENPPNPNEVDPNNPDAGQPKKIPTPVPSLDHKPSVYQKIKSWIKGA
jgi:phage-related protein (TIGR01555 family)